MLERKIGNYYVTSGLMDEFKEVCGEDGPYTRRIVTPIITAAHERGKIYVYQLPLANEDEGDAVVKALPDCFDASKDEYFSFWRTSYGSDDWGPEDEYEMADEEEKAHWFR